jgi:nicotinate-nucleotide adenylyltransferase
MLKLAINGNRHFAIDSHEMYSPEYIPTVKSLQLLRKKIGITRPIYFLIGEDSLVMLDTWDDWQNLFNLTSFIVAMRPGYRLEQMSKKLAQEYNQRLIKNKADFNAANGQIFILDFAPLDISSTKIRNNVKQGLPIDNMVNHSVERYINDNKLYFMNKVC